MKLQRFFYAAIFLLSILQTQNSYASASQKIAFQAEVWADNWFELYINGIKVGQDSIPITKEKSFNSEKIKFSALYPLTVGLIAKDYTENASGLEYIGQGKQQIGDGGVILQIREVSSGKVVGYTTNNWKVFTTNTAPTNLSCEKSQNPLKECLHKDVASPEKWNTSTFDDSLWKTASAYSEDAVGVKEGYFNFKWNLKATLIWSSSLKLDNTILLRSVIKK